MRKLDGHTDRSLMEQRACQKEICAQVFVRTDIGPPSSFWDVGFFIREDWIRADKFSISIRKKTFIMCRLFHTALLKDFWPTKYKFKFEIRSTKSETISNDQNPNAQNGQTRDSLLAQRPEERNHKHCGTPNGGTPGQVRGRLWTFEPFCRFEHWNIWVLNLFRISSFDIRISKAPFTPDQSNLSGKGQTRGGGFSEN